MKKYKQILSNLQDARMLRQKIKCCRINRKLDIRPSVETYDEYGNLQEDA